MFNAWRFPISLNQILGIRADLHNRNRFWIFHSKGYFSITREEHTLLLNYLKEE